MDFNETFVIVNTDELNELVVELYEAMMDNECDEAIKACEKMQRLLKYIKSTYLV